MAYIVKIKDVFHPCGFVCSNCDNFLFAYCANDEHSLRFKDGNGPLKQFPTLCTKCLEPLELEHGILDFYYHFDLDYNKNRGE